MGAIATGVSVVTTDGLRGRFGQTVSSFCSVSADPPQMLACLRRQSPICAAIDANGCFAINVLSETDARIAESFAGRLPRRMAYDFALGDWEEDALGSPMLLRATASFSCRLEQRMIRDSHAVYIGVVISVGRNQTSPLLHRLRRYGRYRASE